MTVFTTSNGNKCYPAYLTESRWSWSCRTIRVYTKGISLRLTALIQLLSDYVTRYFMCIHLLICCSNTNKFTSIVILEYKISDEPSIENKLSRKRNDVVTKYERWKYVQEWTSLTQTLKKLNVNGSSVFWIVNGDVFHYDDSDDANIPHFI